MQEQILFLLSYDTVLHSSYVVFELTLIFLSQLLPDGHDVLLDRPVVAATVIAAVVLLMRVALDQNHGLVVEFHILPKLLRARVIRSRAQRQKVAQALQVIEHDGHVLHVLVELLEHGLHEHGSVDPT